ncbi:hypothetical protein ACTXT7_007708 [Hymenolepis weldensis]
MGNFMGEDAPEACSIDLLRLAMVSLPDENRIALQSLLHFLYALSLRCSLTQSMMPSVPIVQLFN